jgi:hypothetical protein
MVDFLAGVLPFPKLQQMLEELQASVGELKAKLGGQDVCNGIDVPLSSAAMPLSESHQLRWWMLTQQKV